MAPFENLPSLDSDRIDPGVMFGRKFVFRSARALGSDQELEGMFAGRPSDPSMSGVVDRLMDLSGEQLDYAMAVIGEDLGASGCVVVDLRSGEVLIRNDAVTDEEANLWAAAAMFAAAAETASQRAHAGV